MTKFFEVDGTWLCNDCLTPNDIMTSVGYLNEIQYGEEFESGPVTCDRCHAECEYVSILEVH